MTVDNYVAEEVPEGFGHLLRVCNLGDPSDHCKMDPIIFTATVDKDVFVEEVVIASELGNGSDEATYFPKELKLYFWEGDLPEDYCRDECMTDRAPLTCSEDLSQILKKECGNFDDDSCLEYGEEMEVVENCGNGELCSDGVCEEVSLFAELVCRSATEVKVSSGCVDSLSSYPCGSEARTVDRGDCDCDWGWRGRDCKDKYECWDYETVDVECSENPVCPSGYTQVSREECEGCVDSVWVLQEAREDVCDTETIVEESNCGNTREVVYGTKDCTVCVPSWGPTDLSNTCTTSSVTQTDGCGNSRSVFGTKNCVADLVATLTRTTTERVYDAGCYSNKCYYQVSAKNNGDASGVVWKRVLGGAASAEEVYNQAVNPGATFDLGQEWVKSDCYASYSYSVNIYDDHGESIGAINFVCPHP